jgi:hypothetical protein
MRLRYAGSVSRSILLTDWYVIINAQEELRICAFMGTWLELSATWYTVSPKEVALRLYRTLGNENVVTDGKTLL